MTAVATDVKEKKSSHLFVKLKSRLLAKITFSRFAIDNTNKIRFIVAVAVLVFFLHFHLHTCVCATYCEFLLITYCYFNILTWTVLKQFKFGLWILCKHVCVPECVLNIVVCIYNEMCKWKSELMATKLCNAPCQNQFTISSRVCACICLCV